MNRAAADSSTEFASHFTTESVKPDNLTTV